MMQNSIISLNLKLDQIISGLNSLSYENFDETYPAIADMITDAHGVLENLKKKQSIEEIRAAEPLLSDKTKLIKKLFDNIIERKEKEQSEVLIQLKMIQNQRKLANYR